jgi:addiction module HigA family antidote
MAIKANFEPGHVGGFLKRSVLPDDISVTDAAKVLGVGSPALSQLLNEKAALSPEMALRFEKAFGVKMDTLLRVQARYDAWHMRTRAARIKVKPYAPGRG